MKFWGLSTLFLALFSLSLARFLYELFPFALPFLAEPLLVIPLGLAVAAAGAGGLALLQRGARASGGSAGSPRTLAILAPLALFGLYQAVPQRDPLTATLLLLLALFLALGSALLSGGGGASLDAGDQQAAPPRAGAALYYPLGAASLALAGYLFTLAPSVLSGDSGELQVAVASLGITHPTGYPLYLLLGNLLARIPLGEVAYRVNLFSALTAAAAVGATALLGQRLLGHAPTAAAGALLLGFSPVFWRQAVVAEVYALHALLVAALLWVLLGPHPRNPQYRLALLALLTGLSLAHHRTTILVLPALWGGWWLLQGTAGRSARRWMPAGLLALTPLLLYLYVPWRWPALYGTSVSWEEFSTLVLGLRYQFLLHWDAWFREGERWALLGRVLGENLTGVGLALAVLGLAALLRRQWKQTLVLAGVCVPLALFLLVYHVPDVEAFFLPALLVGFLWVGAGAGALGAAVARLLRWPALRRAVPVGLLAVLLMVAWLGQGQGLRAAWDGEPAELAQTVPLDRVRPGSLIVADVARLAPLRYASSVLQGRNDLTIVMPDTEDKALELMDAALSQSRGVYLARFLPRLGERYSLRSVGPLAEVLTSPPQDVPPSLSPLGVFAEGPQLLRAQAPETVAQGSVLTVNLLWRQREPPKVQWQPRLRLVDGRGQVQAEEPPGDPVGGLYPLPQWRPGEVVTDHHRWRIGVEVPPGRYQLELRLVAPFQGEAAPLVGLLPAHALPLGELGVLPSPIPPRPEQPAFALFGSSLLLTGYQLAPAPAGKGLSLTLFWEARQPANLYTIEIEELMGQEGGARSSRQVLNPKFRYFTSSHPLLLPEGSGQPPRTLTIGVKDGESPLPVRGRWLSRHETRLRLPLPSFLSAPLGAANFQNRIALLEHRHQEEARAGELVRVELRWRALTPLGESYTVFVHILDSGGRIWGQVDLAPQGGTLPTDRWQPGQEVPDTYRVPLSPATPPGDYTIEIGLYSPVTLQRLPRLDPQGHPVADHYILGQFRVR